VIVVIVADATAVGGAAARVSRFESSEGQGEDVLRLEMAYLSGDA
jgi:hypothetical protein